MSEDLLHLLLERQGTHIPGTQPSYNDEAFKYRLDILKSEIDLIDRSLARDETRSQNIKNFAVVAWAATLSVFLGQSDLRKFTITITIIPLIFWFLDAWWASLMMGVHIRAQAMRDFINSDRLNEAFEHKAFINFDVLDTIGKSYQGTMKYKRYTTLSRIMLFKELVILYGGLTTVCIILGIVTLLIF